MLEITNSWYLLSTCNGPGTVLVFCSYLTLKPTQWGRCCYDSHFAGKATEAWGSWVTCRGRAWIQKGTAGLQRPRCLPPQCPKGKGLSWRPAGPSLIQTLTASKLQVATQVTGQQGLGILTEFVLILNNPCWHWFKSLNYNLNFLVNNSFYRWGNRRPQTISNLSRDTQLGEWGVKVVTQACLSPAPEL